MANKYVYQPLYPGHIRIIHISIQSSKATYDLLHVPYTNTPPYSALSYTWDNQLPTCTLPINNLTLPITPNVHAFLSQLITTLPSPGYYYIWIDGLCINQSDSPEKNTQVSLMREIYTLAQTVIIWLGQESSLIHDAIEQLPLLTQNLDGFDGRLGLESEDLEKYELPAPGSDIWLGLQELLSHNWFTRVWVFQEVLLARSSHIMCGNTSIPLATLRSFVVQLIISRSTSLIERSLHGRKTDAYKGIRSIKAIQAYLQKFEATIGRYWEFFDILIMGRHLNATDKRDKVYGFLGLAPEEVRKRIRPDYSRKGVVDVYVEVTRFFVETDPVLNILHHVSHDVDEGEGNDDEGLDLPSWCPNFNTHRAGLLGDPSTGIFAGFSITDTSDEDAKMRASFLPNSNVLLVEGLHIDTIKDTQAPGWKWWDEAPEIEGTSTALQTLSWIDACLEIAIKAYPTPEEAIEAHAKTLVADVSNGQRCTSDQQYIYRSMRDILEFKAPEKTNSAELIDRITLSTQIDARAVENYRRRVDVTCDNRVYFSTRSGRAGLGPSITRNGDLVFTIRNTWTPFILRPSKKESGNFRLIGEAYVHGLMYGEAFGLSLEDAFQTIRLD